MTGNTCRPRRVRFSVEESSNDPSDVSVEIVGPLLIPSSEMTLPEKREIWYQPKEFVTLLENAKILASESRRRDAAEQGINTNSYASTLSSVYKSCCKDKGPNSKQRHRLSQWHNVAHTRRGLERICSREVGVDRAKQKKAAIQGVLVAQERLKKNASQEDKEKLLSAVSKTLTRSARLFAAVMGEADARAIGVMQQEDLLSKDFRTRDLLYIDDGSSPQSKALAKLRIGARILRRASHSGVSKIYGRESKRRRASSSALSV